MWIGRVGSEATAGPAVGVAMSSEAKFAAMAAGSFCQARGARSGFSTSSATVYRDFVREGASNVQGKVIDKESCPWAEYDDANDKLRGVWSAT